MGFHLNSIFRRVLQILIFIAILLGLIFLYFNRDQSIDFSVQLPPELEYCETVIESNSLEYLRLKNWLESNQDGWKNTIATYVPVNTVRAPTISINILQNFVVINYQDKNKKWSQVVKQKKGVILLFCNKK